MEYGAPNTFWAEILCSLKIVVCRQLFFDKWIWVIGAVMHVEHVFLFTHPSHLLRSY